MPKEITGKSTKKVQVTFTIKQVDLIDKLCNIGRLGNKRADVIKQIVLLYIHEEEKKGGL
ncbi:MAG: hypothetical protein WC613_00320 [Candidatus Aenigmatarchaeota archaeon]